MTKNTWLMSAALIALMSISCAANAHDHEGRDKSGSAITCERGHLSEAKMKLLHETMMRVHESNKNVFEEMHKLHEERYNVLTAESFDKKAFLAITLQIEKRREQLEKSRVQAFASIADRFTPEEREHLTQMFLHHHHHNDWQHAGWRHGEGHEGWERHEDHEGWHHHDGRTEGMNGDHQSSRSDDQKDYPPYNARSY